MFGTQKKEEIDSLAHTRWNCKYHIVFAPKYRRQAIYGQIRTDIGSILRKLCEYKGVEIIEAETCPDHIHMLVSIPPKYSVSQFMGYLICDEDSGFKQIKHRKFGFYLSLDFVACEAILFSETDLDAAFWPF